MSSVRFIPEVPNVSDLTTQVTSGKNPATTMDRIDEVASPTVTAADTIDSSTRPRDLEPLWKARAFDQILPIIEGEIATLAQTHLESLGPQGLEQWVETLYLRQHQLIGIANDPALRDKPGLPRRALELLKRLGDLQTPVFERAVTLADAREATPVQAWQVFCNTAKKPGYHTLSETQKYFVDKLKAFVTKGGDFRDIMPVTAATLAALKNGDMCEWVVDKFDVARMSSSEAHVAPGHTLLGWGQDALAAGSMRVFKDASGEVAQVIIGTFSGHYRSSAAYSAKLARHLVAAGIPPERIIIQGGEAGTPRALELLYRALGRDGTELQTHLAALEAEASHFNPVAKIPDEPPSAPQVGPNPEKVVPNTPALNEGRLRMNRAVVQALGSGVALTDARECTALLGTIANVLLLAEAAGDRAAYDDALATLHHLATLDDARLDPTAKKELKAAWDKATRHVFGASAHDVATLFGPGPISGRRARIIVSVSPTISAASLRALVAAGADVVRISAGETSPADLARCLKTIRGVETDGRTVTTLLDLPSLPTENRFDAFEALLKSVGEAIDLVTLPHTSDLADVMTLRGIMARLNRVLPIVAIIDSPAGVDNLDRIAKAADGLLVEPEAIAAALGAESVPGLERRVHALANRMGRASIVSTAISLAGGSSRHRAAEHAEIDAVYDAIATQSAEAVLLVATGTGATLTAETIRKLARVVSRAEEDARDEVYRTLATSSPETARDTIG